MPEWYPLVRAARYYKGAYTVEELAARPAYITRWALEAEAAEAEGQRIAEVIAKQEAEMKADAEGDDE